MAPQNNARYNGYRMRTQSISKHNLIEAHQPPGAALIGLR